MAHKLTNIELGQMAHDFLHIVSPNAKFWQPLPESTTQHLVRMIKTSMEVGFFKASHVEASNYIDNMHVPTYVRTNKAIMPYMAYANFLTRITAPGIEYLHSNVPEIQERYPEYDRGHIDSFLRSLYEDHPKVQ